MNEITVTKLTAWIWSIIPVVAGSVYAFITTQKIESNEPKKHWVIACFNFMIALFIAYIISQAIIDYFLIKRPSYAAFSVEIVTGLFLIPIVSEASKQIPKFFDAIRVKWFGS